MGAIIDAFDLVDVGSLTACLFLILVLVHTVPYLVDPHGFRSYPGPFWAKFSDAWLGSVAASGHRSEVVHAMHRKYGRFCS
jgi:benzoate 4-monooxygenase